MHEFRLWHVPSPSATGVLGGATEILPGQFQFPDLLGANAENISIVCARRNQLDLKSTREQIRVR